MVLTGALSARSISLLVRGGVALVVVFGLLRDGIARRKGIWSAQSWWRFGMLVGLGVALFALAMAMATGVDHGIYDGLSEGEHQAYFGLLMSLMLLSAALVSGPILWLARSSPQRELTLSNLFTRWKSTAGAAPMEPVVNRWLTDSAQSDRLGAFAWDLLVIVALPVGLVSVTAYTWKPWGRVYAAPTPGEVFTVLAQGTWDWSRTRPRCDDDPWAITFSPDHSLIFFTYRKAWRDKSTGSVVNAFALSIGDSTRSGLSGTGPLTKDGQVVKWTLTLRTPTAYLWTRSDWEPPDETQAVRRCPGSSHLLTCCLHLPRSRNSCPLAHWFAASCCSIS
jgi:hypothetical protein